jgi:hypothetical protein
MKFNTLSYTVQVCMYLNRMLFHTGDSEGAVNQEHQESSDPAVHCGDIPYPDAHLRWILGVWKHCSALHAELCIWSQICTHSRQRCSLPTNSRFSPCKLSFLNILIVIHTLIKT